MRCIILELFSVIKVMFYRFCKTGLESNAYNKINRIE